MQVTFLIGNGFDLNLGLETKYAHFYPLYLSSPKFAVDDPDILAFKELLAEDGSYARWADFERALGEHTTEPPLNNEASLRKCLKDFKRCFAQYLQQEEDRINFDDCGRSMAQKFAECLYTHRNYLEPRPFRIVQSALPIKEISNYHILDFNYTTIIDRLFPLLSFSDLRGDNKGRLIHVHGTHTSGMILGVDNLSQVANPDLFTFAVQQRLFLKPLLNQQSGQGHDQDAVNCINQSDEICIFGMSLGETDLIWWQRIGRWLDANSRRQLLIFTRGQALDPLIPEDILDYQDKIRNLFLSRTELTPENYSDFWDRIHIVITSDFFCLEPVLKVPPIGNPSPPSLTPV